MNNKNRTAQSPLAMFYHWESVKPDAIYLRQPMARQWHQYSWREVGEQARRISAALQFLGLGQSKEQTDRICILSNNCAHWLITDLATMMSGCSLAPAFTSMTADNVLYILQHSGAKVLFVGQTDNWQQVKHIVPEHVTVISLPFVDIPEADYRWEDLLTIHAPQVGNFEPAATNELTTIYTSGSTGAPKGVMYSFESAGHIARDLGHTFRMQESDRMISYLPMAHAFERAMVGFVSMFCGATVGFNEGLATFAEDMRIIRPTVFQCVPRLWTKFQQGVLAKFGGQDILSTKLADPEQAEPIKLAIKKALGLDAGRILLTGSAPTPMPMHLWYESLDMPLCEIYGQSEVLSGSSNLPWDRKLGTLGKPTFNTDIQIADNGEIMIKAKGSMAGYLNEPEKTAATMINGWIYTGDKGEIDSDGYLKITGRVKEIFKTAKAKYVAPVPIEGLFVANTDIDQVCLMGSGLPQTVLLVNLGVEGKSISKAMVNEKIVQQMLEINNEIESHAKIASVIIVDEPWSAENGLLTHTLKLKRSAIENKFSELAEDVFERGASVKQPLMIWETDIDKHVNKQHCSVLKQIAG